MKAAGDLLKEIKSKKHKKDPFDKNYVQHALSELKVGSESEDDDRFQGLATDLKIRSEIINSQLKFLTDKVNEVSKQDDGSNKNEQRSTTVVPPIAPVESEYQEIDDIVTKKMEMLEMISSLSASELQEYCSANLSTNIPWIEGLVTNMSVERMKAYTSLDGFYAPKEVNKIPILDEMNNEVRDYFAAQKLGAKSENDNFKQKIVPYLKLVEPFSFDDDAHGACGMEQEEEVVNQMRFDDTAGTDSVDSDEELPREKSKADAMVSVSAGTRIMESGAKIGGLTFTGNKKRKDTPKASSRIKYYASSSSTAKDKDKDKDKDKSLPTLDDLRHNYQHMQQDLNTIRSKRKKEPVIFVNNWKENNTPDTPGKRDRSNNACLAYNVFHVCSASFESNINTLDSEFNRFMMVYPATVAVPKRNHLKIENCNSLFFGIKACLHCWLTHQKVRRIIDRDDGSDANNVSNLPIEQVQFDDFFENDMTICDDEQAETEHVVEESLQLGTSANTIIAVGNNLFYPNVVEMHESVPDDSHTEKRESRLLTRLNLGAIFEDKSQIVRTRTSVTPSITVSMLQNLIKKRLSNRRNTTIDLAKLVQKLDTVIDEDNKEELERLTKRTFISTILLADDFNRHSKNNQMSLESASGNAVDISIKDIES